MALIFGHLGRRLYGTSVIWDSSRFLYRRTRQSNWFNLHFDPRLSQKMSCPMLLWICARAWYFSLITSHALRCRGGGEAGCEGCECRVVWEMIGSRQRAVERGKCKRKGSWERARRKGGRQGGSVATRTGGKLEAGAAHDVMPISDVNRSEGRSSRGISSPGGGADQDQVFPCRVVPCRRQPRKVRKIQKASGPCFRTCLLLNSFFRQQFDMKSGSVILTFRRAAG